MRRKGRGLQAGAFKPDRVGEARQAVAAIGVDTPPHMPVP